MLTQPFLTAVKSCSARSINKINTSKTVISQFHILLKEKNIVKLLFIEIFESIWT